MMGRKGRELTDALLLQQVDELVLADKGSAWAPQPQPLHVPQVGRLRGAGGWHIQHASVWQPPLQLNHRLHACRNVFQSAYSALRYNRSQHMCCREVPALCKISRWQSWGDVRWLQIGGHGRWASHPGGFALHLRSTFAVLCSAVLGPAQRAWHHGSNKVKHRNLLTHLRNDDLRSHVICHCDLCSSLSLHAWRDKESLKEDTGPLTCGTHQRPVHRQKLHRRTTPRSEPAETEVLQQGSTLLLVSFKVISAHKWHKAASSGEQLKGHEDRGGTPTKLHLSTHCLHILLLDMDVGSSKLRIAELQWIRLLHRLHRAEFGGLWDEQVVCAEKHPLVQPLHA